MSRYLRQLAHHAGVAPVPPPASRPIAAVPEPASQHDIEEQIVERDAPTPITESFSGDRSAWSAARNDRNSAVPATSTSQAESQIVPEPAVLRSDRVPISRNAAVDAPSSVASSQPPVAGASPASPTDKSEPELNAQQVLQRVLAWIGERENAAPAARATPSGPLVPPSADVLSSRTTGTEAVPVRPLPGVVAIGGAREPVRPSREREDESTRSVGKPAEPAPVSVMSVASPPAKPLPVVAARRADPPVTPPPEIHVSIGAIELTVEAPPPPPRPAPPPPAPSRPQSAARSDHAPRAVLSTRARRQYQRPFP